MIPQLLLLETPPELYYLEEMFERNHYPRSHFEKVLKDIFLLMRSKQNVEVEVPRWIDRFRYAEPVVGELLYRPMQTMTQRLFAQFNVWGLYLPDGQMPYAYKARDEENILYRYDEAYSSLRATCLKEIQRNTLSSLSATTIYQAATRF